MTTKPIEVDVIVRGLSVLNPKDSGSQSSVKVEIKRTLLSEISLTGRLILNQWNSCRKHLIVTQPDGSVKVLPDPKAGQNYNVDMLMTLEGKGRITDSGPVLENNKIKIGTPVELEGQMYNFKCQRD